MKDYANNLPPKGKKKRNRPSNKPKQKNPKTQKQRIRVWFQSNKTPLLITALIILILIFVATFVSDDDGDDTLPSHPTMPPEQQQTDATTKDTTKPPQQDAAQATSNSDAPEKTNQSDDQTTNTTSTDQQDVHDSDHKDAQKDSIQFTFYDQLTDQDQATLAQAKTASKEQKTLYVGRFETRRQADQKRANMILANIKNISVTQDHDEYQLIIQPVKQDEINQLKDKLNDLGIDDIVITPYQGDS